LLNFETLEFATGNDLPYFLFLPTYTATAMGITKSSTHRCRAICNLRYGSPKPLQMARMRTHWQKAIA